MSKRSKEETQLQSRIIERLKGIGVWAVRMGVVTRRPGLPVPNSGEPGQPDIWTHLGWMEVKLPGEELDPDQVEWHAKAQRFGVPVGTVRSVADALRLAMGWLRRKERAA
jgi:hypothetical protein